MRDLVSDHVRRIQSVRTGLLRAIAGLGILLLVQGPVDLIHDPDGDSPATAPLRLSLMTLPRLSGLA